MVVVVYVADLCEMRNDQYHFTLCVINFDFERSDIAPWKKLKFRDF